MANITFPSTPTVGQVHQASSGVYYKWNGSAWISKGSIGGTYINNIALADLPDVTTSALADGDILRHNGTDWINVPFNETVDDRLNTLIIAGTNILVDYNDAANTLTISAIADNSSVKETITQTAHGFVLGDVLGQSATTFVKAIADNAANSEVIGIVSVVIDVDNFVITYSGKINTFAGLTRGTTYFLSQTVAGALTSTEPVSGVSKPIFIATSTTSGVVQIQRGVIL